MRNYSKDEIQLASEQVKIDISNGKILSTNHKEITFIQTGESSRIEVVLKYKPDDIKFLEENGYLKKGQIIVE